MSLTEFNQKNFADYVRRVRLKKQYSQLVVATAMGLSQNAYWSLENGKTKITIEHINDIAQVFSLDGKQFLENFFNNII